MPSPATSSIRAEPALGSGDGSATQRLLINVKSSGYSPQTLKARAGVPTIITLRTKSTSGCTQEFVVPALRYQKVLPETGDTRVDVGVLPKGVLAYTCGMGMYRGFIDAG
jgi:plastocyanin domain-containing protein